MRYRVVNLGGMLEDYEREINALKEKLNTGGYMQPGRTPVLPPPPPPAPPPSYPTEVPLAPPISVYGGVPVVAPEHLPENPPTTVSTGIPRNPAEPPWPFTDYGYPTIPPKGECPPGQTWTPAGCRPDVPSQDTYPPLSIREPATPVTPPPSAESSMVTPPPSGVASVDCGPMGIWAGTKCVPRSGGMTPTGGLTNVAFGGGFFGGGGGASAISLMGRAVPLRGVRNLGGPAFSQPIPIRGAAR